jgi:hypothetical protein
MMFIITRRFFVNHSCSISTRLTPAFFVMNIFFMFIDDFSFFRADKRQRGGKEENFN